MKKMPKINIPKQDLQYFTFDNLVVDPFWYDVYCIENKEQPKKIKK